MAKKLTKQDVNEINSQANQMAVNEQALAEIQAMEDKTKMLKQEGLNKAHDPELSAYSDYNGQNDSMENLGVIGVEEIREAYNTFIKYREKKKPLEQKYLDYEKFWQMKHWDVINAGKETTLGAAEDCVGLPMESSKFTTFAQDQYDKLFASLVDGSLVVDNSFDTEKTPAVASISVDYQQ